VKLFSINSYCALLLLICVNLIYAQKNDLQLQEVSRFAFSSHDMATTREPVIRYPYVFMPNSYGFQVSLWDSLSSSFTEIANYGVQGSVNEMVAWQNYLFLAVNYSSFTDVQPDMAALYKVDITDPYHPQPAGSITAGETATNYGNLHIVNNVLLAYDEYYGGLQNLVLFNPADLSQIASYPGHYRFEVIQNQFVLSRPQNSSPFHLFAVNPTTGLEAMGTLSLPHYATNSFPLVFDVTANIVATQCGEGIKLWNTANPNNWELLSEINNFFSARGLYSNGKLVAANYEIAEDVTRFYVYDISNPSAPSLINTANYPPGLGYTASVERMVAYGSYLFHQCMNEGCLCLQLADSGAISFVARCYLHSLSMCQGAKYGNYILRSYARNGITCYDISNPQAPFLAFNLFADNTIRFGVCGDLLLALVNPTTGTNSLENIYNISDLQNPQLVTSFPMTAQTTTFFNYEEPNSFYRLDNSTLTVKKYQVTNNQAQLIISYPIPVEMHSPTFVKGLLYLSHLSSTGNYDLYIYSGFPANNPQEPLYISHFIHSDYSDMYNAGEYAFVRTFSHSLPALFYNSGSTLMVDRDIFGFNFRNYVCIGRQTGVSFYDFSDAAGTYDWAEEDLFLPQPSYSSRIFWDTNYLYLLANDNVSIYSYTITDADDQLLPLSPLNISNYPNPFNPSTAISYTLPSSGNVKISIFNVKGQLLKALVNESQLSGNHQIVWHGDDQNGKQASSGVFFCRIETQGTTFTHKMILMR